MSLTDFSKLSISVAARRGGLGAVELHDLHHVVEALRLVHAVVLAEFAERGCAVLIDAEIRLLYFTHDVRPLFVTGNPVL